MEKSELIQRMENDCKMLAHAHRNRFTKYRNMNIRLGLPTVMLATAAGSLTTISADAVAIASQYSLLEIAGLFCTWTVALFTAANTFLRPQETSQGHKEKAGGYEVLLGQIGRAYEYLSDEELRKDIERIDVEIGTLKRTEPFLSDTRIYKSKDTLIKHGEIPNYQLERD
jgi:hypothetical protein